MTLYSLTKYLWEFDMQPRYDDEKGIPTKSLWKFNLDGYLEFKGNTYGEGHPMMPWTYNNGYFYIQSHYRYGLIEFEFDNQTKYLSGRRILDDGKTSMFKAIAISVFPDSLFYRDYKKILGNTIWRLFTLGALDLYYFEFFNSDNEVILYDNHCLKEIVEHEPNGYDEIKNNAKYAEYIYILDKRELFLVDKTSNECVGKIYMDNHFNLKGLFKFKNKTRTDFIQLSPMSEIQIKEVIASISISEG